jgi:metal-responsive CopG/Arc/MetJ family transcriptional regulator
MISPEPSMQYGITESMKTAISVDDALMEQADEAARELGLSRSRLIADALREYLKKRRRTRIAEQLNTAYADGQTAEERLLVRQMRSKLRALDPW